LERVQDSGHFTPVIEHSTARLEQYADINQQAKHIQAKTKRIGSLL